MSGKSPAEAATLDAEVRGQYETYPYPERDPADERRRLIAGSPSELVELNHCVFGGRRDFARPFRALVAGGGTGDAAILLGQRLADQGDAGRVLYVDVSAASRAIAEERARVRGLANITFATASLLDLPGSDLVAEYGPFDYIDCCGVLHHLDDPLAGLAALVDVLAPGGGLGLMVYGELGRTGVYHAQAMLRLLGQGSPDAAPADRVALARRLLGALPDSNWLRRNPWVADHREAGDAGVYDLLLHRRDRAYTVPEVADLVTRAGLAITSFCMPLRYDPAAFVDDAEVLERLKALTWLERATFAELLTGSIKAHAFYAVRAEGAGAALARPDDAAMVPVPREVDMAAVARDLARGQTATVDLGGVSRAFPLPRLAAPVARLIDGRRDLTAIHAALGQGGTPADWFTFKAAFDALYRVLNGIGKLFLYRPA